jgi:hypothetical protein
LMPTGRVDADQKGRRYGEFRHVRKSWNVKQSELWKEPEFWKTLERRTVGGPTHPENTETPKSRNFRPIRNIRSSTQAEDIREPRHLEEGESKADTKSETGSDVR